MKNDTRELLGFNVPVVGIVETLAEAVTAAGSEQAVLNDYVSNVLAHSHYTILRRKIVETLETLTGIKRKTKTEGEGEKAKQVIDETDGAYVVRLENELGEETLKGFENKIAEVCQGIPVDYVPGTRGSGGSATPAKKWLAAVDQLQSEGKYENFLSKYQIAGDPADEATKIAAANKIKELVSEQLAKAMKLATSL